MNEKQETKLPYIGQPRDKYDDGAVLDYLIGLAQFELTQARKDYLERELNRQRHILAVVEEAFNEIREEGLELQPMTHGNIYGDDLRLPLREDEAQPFENVQGIISNAQDTSGRYFVVPVLPHSKLD